MKFFAFALLILCSCSGYRLPKQYTVENTRVYKMPAQQVATKVLRWCMENEFTVTTKSDDFVTASSNLKRIQQVTFDSWSGLKVGRFVLDCGGSTLNQSQIYMSDNGILNVTITKQADELTEVYVRLSGEIVGGNSTTIAQCNSTGVAEKLLLDYIDGK